MKNYYKNGISRTEISEIITHIAYYAIRVMQHLPCGLSLSMINNTKD